MGLTGGQHADPADLPALLCDHGEWLKEDARDEQGVCLLKIENVQDSQKKVGEKWG
ncbi:MAG TPA: hypothetical protein VIH59_07260 [Candidatus Tectomicrobia bacterium]